MYGNQIPIIVYGIQYSPIPNSKSEAVVAVCQFRATGRAGIFNQSPHLFTDPLIIRIGCPTDIAFCLRRKFNFEQL